jgi:drug/metabolite transporter (DMT)-like permease
MMYLLGIATALQIILAQTLWKQALKNLKQPFDKSFILSWDIFKFAFSFYVLLGVCVYILATITFFVLLSKYKYASAQTIVVVSSLIFTYLSATLIFDEHLKLVNFIGVAFLLVGVFLVTKF